MNLRIGFIATIALFGVTSAAHGQTSSPSRRAAVPGAPAGTTAFIDVAIVPMDTERVLLHQAVLVERGWITAIGSVNEVRVPAGARRIDGVGKYLIPGLGDMHVHLGASAPGGMAKEISGTDSAAAEGLLFHWLANGVTTIRNMDYLENNGEGFVLRLRARAGAGGVWSPYIYTAGPWAPRQYHQRLTKTRSVGDPDPKPDSVAAYVAAYKAAGYDFIKIHNEPGIIFDSLAAASRRLGLPFAGHVPPDTELDRVFASGIGSIEHLTGYIGGSWDNITRPPLVSDDTAASAAHIQSLALQTQRLGIWNCPTEAVRQGIFSGKAQLIKALQDVGANLLLGTDAPERPNPSVQRELQALVESGLTPYQALVTGTRNVAQYFGTLDSTGTVAVGKRADLVLLARNPLDDIRNTVQPRGVMLGGRWLAREDIDRRLAAIGTLAIPQSQP